MLWQRSLVMIDMETKSLWSHLLGRAMRGHLKGSELTALPSVITDWKTWKTKHPETTVLKMSRTSDRFTRDYYKEPGKFVVGMVAAGKARAWPLDELLKQPAVNDQWNGPLLVCLDRNNFATHVYDRRLGSRELTFTLKKDLLVDRQTGSQWDLQTGKAISGPLQGKQLRPRIGIISFRKAWQNFHPESQYWQLNEVRP